MKITDIGPIKVVEWGRDKINLGGRPFAVMRPVEFHIKDDGTVFDLPSVAIVMQGGEVSAIGEISRSMLKPVIEALDSAYDRQQAKMGTPQPSEGAMAEKKLTQQELLELYREHRDGIRASIKALGEKHGAEPVCVATHVANITRLAMDFLPEGDVQRAFNEELGKLVRHWCKRAGVKQELIAELANGIFQDNQYFKAALDEAGYEGGIPLPGGLTDDEGDG